MESAQFLIEYLRKYIARVPGESFGDIFSQYADENFEAELEVNKQEKIVMNKEQYVDYLDNNIPVKSPTYHALSTKIDFSTSEIVQLKAKVTAIYPKDKEYVIVNERHYYSLENNKIKRILDKRSEYVYFDFLDNFEYTEKYPKISLKDIRLKWHVSYDDDGMLSGVAEYENKLVWFECFDSKMDYMNSDDLVPGFNFYRRFLIYELSEDDIEHLGYWNELFIKYVGTHNTYINNERSDEPCLPSDTHHLFFEPYQKAEKRNYRKGTPIGWFQI